MPAPRLFPLPTVAAACRSLCITILVSVILAGCSQGTRPDRPVTDSRIHQQAQALAGRGDYAGAAAIYLQAANSATGAGQQSLYLYAAQNLARANDLDQATRVLDRISATELSRQLQQHYAVTRAEIAIAQLHPNEALDYLSPLPPDGPFVHDYHRLRAEAYLQDNQYFQSARERISLEPYISDPDARLKNEFSIWSAINNLTDTELQQLRTAPAPDILSGWMELVELTRLYMQQPEIIQQVTPHWQRRYPAHPANRAFIPELIRTMTGAGQPPGRISLLLPLSGQLAGAAAAIRDGVMAAYYDSPDAVQLPQINIYDTGNSTQSAIEAYQQAVTEGTQFVIGPLRKEAIQALATPAGLPVPMLALNQADIAAVTEIPLYQFGLAPEDEAREAARFAWREGHMQAIALRPDTAWGNRVYAAFEAEWESLGGIILDQQVYDSNATDHGKLLSAILNLDSSKARHKQLTRLLRGNLKFEPRRRQDVDMVFLLADPRQARLIRPQLSFYRASTLPVFTTSRVYSGEIDTARDIDLNGITFCDMPWILAQNDRWKHLKQSVSEHWPDDAHRYARLYALGIDAYRVTPHLGQLGGNMFGAYHGVSGNLSLDDEGRVTRTLRCATFRNGMPILLDASTDTFMGIPGL